MAYVFSNENSSPVHCVVLVDGVALAAGVALVLAPTMLRLVTAHRFALSPVNLLSEDEGISWCRGWGGDAERALRAAVMLR